MFHLLGYATVTAGPVTAQSLGMVADGSIAQGTVGYRFTEDYRLLASHVHAAALTSARLSQPTLNAIGQWALHPPMLSLAVVGNPNVIDYRDWAPMLPKYEDLQVICADTAVGGEAIEAFLWLGTQAWTPYLDQVKAVADGSDTMAGRRMLIRFSQATTKGVNTWGPDTALTFDQIPRGGVYAVVGCSVVAVGCNAFRINFPRSPTYANGRKLFPGDLCINAYGDVPKRQGRNWMGLWGIWHTFEPPFLQIWGQAAGAVTVQGFMDVVYLGGSTAPDQMLNRAFGAMAA